MAGQWQDPEWQDQQHVQPNVQNSPPQGNYPQQWQPQYPPYPPQYVQPPVQVNVQQFAYGPGRAVTVQPLGFGWTMFHLFMTLGTGGLWGFVWYAHARSRRQVTRFY